MTAPAEARAKLGALRAEFADRLRSRAPAAWARLHVDTRSILLMLAGVDPASEHDLPSLALRDWREFTPPERQAIAEAAEALRWQLNGARDLGEKV